MYKKQEIHSILFLLTINVAVLMQELVSFGHNGKKHPSGSFTPLRAIQKTIVFYSRLINSGMFDGNLVEDGKKLIQ